jgi:hypothetical protein
LVEPRWAKKTAEFRGKTRGGSPDGAQQPRVFVAIDVTVAHTSLWVDGKKAAFRRDLRRLDFLSRFSKFCVNGRGQRGGT